MYKLLALLFAVPVLLFGAVEDTLVIIKPDAVNRKHIGDIIHRYEADGFKIKNMKMVELSKRQAEEFYAEHKSKPFFEELTTFMSSGPIVVMQLEGDDAIMKNRKLIGDTNPQKAEPNTLRALYGQSKARNSIHGSDSSKAAFREVDFFFGQKL